VFGPAVVHLASMNTFRSTLASLSVFALLGACAPQGDDEGEEEVGEDDGAPTEECLSGFEWIGGNEESPLMNPGQDCLACHSQMGVEEEVVLGGTVFADNERNNCFGVEGVTVEITDSTNTVFELNSNASGNFFLEVEDGAGITPPYSVRLTYEGRERRMLTMQTVTSCNSCHTETGANGAPGRILAP
jgi:hypothetical protein